VPKIDLDGLHDLARVRAIMSFPEDDTLRHLYFVLADINDTACSADENALIRAEEKAIT